jgi:hypothetical protein
MSWTILLESRQVHEIVVCLKAVGRVCGTPKPGFSGYWGKEVGP